MLIGIGIDEELGPVAVDRWVDRVRLAADRGFASAWAAQLIDGDALTALAVVGREVPRIALGMAIVPTYPRHPPMLAGQALTVQAATGNRLSLGVGPGLPFFTEDRFGYSLARPLRDMREYLSILGPLLRGESVDVRGETWTAVGPVRVPGATPPSLLLSALGPNMLRLAGELTDGTATGGWAGPITLADYIVPTIARAAAEFGRPAPRVVAGAMVSVTADEAAARAWIAERYGMAGQLPSTRALLDREGAADVADVVIVGDDSAVERQVKRYAEAGATELIVTPFGSDEERARTIALLGSLAGTASAASRWSAPTAATRR